MSERKQQPGKVCSTLRSQDERMGEMLRPTWTLRRSWDEHAAENGGLFSLVVDSLRGQAGERLDGLQRRQALSKPGERETDRQTDGSKRQRKIPRAATARERTTGRTAEGRRGTKRLRKGKRYWEMGSTWFHASQHHARVFAG